MDILISSIVLVILAFLAIGCVCAFSNATVLEKREKYLTQIYGLRTKAFQNGILVEINEHQSVQYIGFDIIREYNETMERYVFALLIILGWWRVFPKFFYDRHAIKRLHDMASFILDDVIEVFKKNPRQGIGIKVHLTYHINFVEFTNVAEEHYPEFVKNVLSDIGKIYVERQNVLS